MHEHRTQAVDQLGELDVLLALLGQRLVHGGDRENPVHRVLERFARIDVRGARLDPQERRHRLEVVLHAVVDLLCEHPPHHGTAVLERNRRVMRNRLEQRAVLVGERGVAVCDELADLPALPAQRRAHRVPARPALGPCDATVLEDERGAGRTDRFHRRLHDRLERLLEVQRLGDGLRDLRERLQLRDPTLSLRVELRVHDRLGDLVGDRLEQLHLVAPIFARHERPHVQRAREHTAGEDRHREDRLVLLLGQVRKLLEARVEVRRRRDHHRGAFRSGAAGDPLAGTHSGPPCHLVDAQSVGRPEHELVGPLVVEIDEAGIRSEGVCHLVCDEVEHLLEVERRVDGGSGLGQEPQVPLGRVHAPHRTERDEGGERAALTNLLLRPR